MAVNLIIVDHFIHWNLTFPTALGTVALNSNPANFNSDKLFLSPHYLQTLTGKLPYNYKNKSNHNEQAMADESKPVQPTGESKDKQSAESAPPAQVESENEEDNEELEAAESTAAAGAGGKKKKSKRKRIKAALTGGGSSDAGPSREDEKEKISKAVGGLSKDQIAQLLSLNPALAREIAGDKDLSAKETVEAFKKLNLQDIMTGLAASGKNVKEAGSYKFWQTQPVPQFGDEPKKIIEEGPFKIVDIEKVPKEPGPLVAGFEWVTIDLTNDDVLKEVYELLDQHYVEDGEAMFRFSYSKSFLRW